MKDAEGVDESVETLFGADAGEVSDREGFAGCCPGLPVMFGQVDAQGQGVELPRVESEVANHVITVVVAVDDEPVEVGSQIVDRLDRLAAIRLDQIFQEDVIALENTHQRDVDLFPDRAGSSRQQSIGEADDIGLERRAEGVSKFQDVSAVRTVFALEHVECHCSQLSGVGADTEAGCQTQGPGPVDPAGQGSRQTAEQAAAVCQVDTDPTEIDFGGTDILFVDSNRRVCGDQADVGPLVDQRAGPGGVVHARTAEHPGPAGGDDGDVHGRQSNPQRPFRRTVAAIRPRRGCRRALP